MGQPHEIVAVVDKNNKIIEYKKYGDLADSDIWRIVSIWVENSQGQVLLQQRSWAKKRSPGLWTPAAEGTVTENDSYDETAIRELEEEIGLSHTTLKPIKQVLAKMPFGWRQVYGYFVHCDWPLDKFTIQKEEVAQIAWVDKKQLIAELQGKVPPSREYPSSAAVWLELFDLV
jgi:isopentenyldiphosphate isomerase